MERFAGERQTRRFSGCWRRHSRVFFSGRGICSGGAVGLRFIGLVGGALAARSSSRGRLLLAARGGGAPCWAALASTLVEGKSCERRGNITTSPGGTFLAKVAGGGVGRAPVIGWVLSAGLIGILSARAGDHRGWTKFAQHAREEGGSAARETAQVGFGSPGTSGLFSLGPANLSFLWCRLCSTRLRTDQLFWAEGWV